MAGPHDGFEVFEATSLYCPRCRHARNACWSSRPAVSTTTSAPSAALPSAPRWTTIRPNFIGRSRLRPDAFPVASAESVVAVLDNSASFQPVPVVSEQGPAGGGYPDRTNILLRGPIGVCNTTFTSLSPSL